MGKFALPPLLAMSLFLVTTNKPFLAIRLHKYNFADLDDGLNKIRGVDYNKDPSNNAFNCDFVTRLVLALFYNHFITFVPSWDVRDENYFQLEIFYGGFRMGFFVENL